MKYFLLVTAAHLLACTGVFAQQTKPTEIDSGRSNIEEAATKFVEFYNAHDPKALAALFSDDAELVQPDGTRFVGKMEIESAFGSSFEANPQAKISISVESIRFLTPDVAVEDGSTTWYPDGVTATSESAYRVAHVKRDGKWLMAGARTMGDKVLSNYEYLLEIEWLVGEWIDEGGDAVVETSFRWAPNRAFLVRDFNIKTGGQTVLNGTQRIGWDSRRKQLRCWTFDSEGGYVEGFWTPVGDGYVIRSTGYLRDGSAVSGTTRFDRKSKDRIEWSMFNRLRGENIIPDVNVTIVRKPPQPKVVSN